jgi:methylenetetrahydrofolate dehydrogenase (NADP+)/methenyltetrahydrofolate cyclohydrolase
MTLILDGKKAAAAWEAVLTEKFKNLAKPPTLSIIKVGNRADADAYIRAKKQLGERLGVAVEVVKLAESATETDLRQAIEARNENEEINGIIVQLPLPAGWRADQVLASISPEKDADALTAARLRDLLWGKTDIAPATAKGLLQLLEFYDLHPAGRKVTVVGRSLLAGKTVALSLLNADATVTISHRATPNLPAVTREADIIVVAAGSPGLIGRQHVRPGQIVVDLGINEIGGKSKKETGDGRRKLVGDVLFDEVFPIVAAISPVPGGAGPMTVAALFDNLFKLASGEK